MGFGIWYLGFGIWGEDPRQIPSPKSKFPNPKSLRVAVKLGLVWAIFGAAGCAATGRDVTGVKVAEDVVVRLDAAVSELVKVSNELAIQLGDVSVGGGGDSVVSWLAVVGLILGAYPVQRKLRLWRAAVGLRAESGDGSDGDASLRSA